MRRRKSYWRNLVDRRRRRRWSLGIKEALWCNFCISIFFMLLISSYAVVMCVVQYFRWIMTIVEWETRENKGEKCGLDIEIPVNCILPSAVQRVFAYIPIECTSEIALFIHHEIWLIAICIFLLLEPFFCTS